MRKRGLYFLGFALLLFTVHAGAHTGATGVVKQRMELMKDTGQQMKIIGEMIKGTAVFDAELIRESAERISRHATEIKVLFPEGSNQSPTEALPIIWEEWDEFAAIADKMRSEADELSRVVPSAATASEIAPQFGKIGKTCSGCHEVYRLKK